VDESNIGTHRNPPGDELCTVQATHVSSFLFFHSGNAAFEIKRNPVIFGSLSSFLIAERFPHEQSGVSDKKEHQEEVSLYVTKGRCRHEGF
jgi:hypothetical protein